MTKAVCNDCEFFHREDSEISHGMASAACRRFPPLCRLFQTGPPTAEGYFFPVVGAAEWCGEHRAVITPD